MKKNKHVCSSDLGPRPRAAAKSARREAAPSVPAMVGELRAVHDSLESFLEKYRSQLRLGDQWQLEDALEGIHSVIPKSGAAHPPAGTSVINEPSSDNTDEKP